MLQWTQVVLEVLLLIGVGCRESLQLLLRVRLLGLLLEIPSLILQPWEASGVPGHTLVTRSARLQLWGIFERLHPLSVLPPIAAHLIRLSGDVFELLAAILELEGLLLHVWVLERRQHVVFTVSILLHLRDRIETLRHGHETLDKQRWRADFHLGALLALCPIFNEFDLRRLLNLEAAASEIAPCGNLADMLVRYQLHELRIGLCELLQPRGGATG